MINEGDVLYPQALHKQLFGKADYKEFDIKVDINSLAKFYFPANFKRQQHCDEISFSDLLYHEINHGLGFATSISNYDSGLLTPNPSTTRSRKGKYRKGIKFPNSAFDKHLNIGSHQKQIAEAVKRINQLGEQMDPRTQKPSEAIRSFKNAEEMREFQQLMASNQINFKTSSNTYLPLEASYTPFSTESSISHFSTSKELPQQDQFMRAYLKLGAGSYSLDYDPSWKTSPFGPGALQVLQSPGIHA
ncbi:hypothetical protein DSO57_1018033 [Entomophthora muscae]|uniref:Uncharacterized protein n=1 Tax=Entomophthora muscae TaxID=34485 RepID=A0ACC2UQ03_9FUNG|nr:hypothetical protein DSO57_1018033 [Entomophthora muscae]